MRVRGAVAGVLAMLTTAGVLAVAPAESVVAEAPGVGDAAGLEGFVDHGQVQGGPAPVVPGSSAPLLGDGGISPGEWSYPEVGVVVFEVGDDASAMRGAAGVVSVEAVEGLGGDGRRVEVEIVGREVADGVGAAGYVFRVSDATEVAEGSPDEARSATEEGLVSAVATVQVSADIAAVAERFGGDFEQRLVLRVLPMCAFERVVPLGCDVDGELLEAELDLDAMTLTAELELPASRRSRFDDDIQDGPDAEPGLDADADDAHADADDSETDLDDGLGSGEDDVTGPDSSTTSTTVPDVTTTTSTTVPVSATPPGVSPSEAVAPGVGGGQLGAPRRGVSDESGGVASFESDVPLVLPEGFGEGAVDEMAEYVPSPEVEALFGDGLMVGVMSASGGPAGSYVSTPLSLSSTWSVGPGTGSFNYAYPIPVPAGPAGDAPAVSLNYSSAAVDGMVASESSQASPVGLGWSLNEAYIERPYRPCALDGVPPATDLCWHNTNLFLHLNGVSTELVHQGGNEYRAKNDPNWRVQETKRTLNRPLGAPIRHSS